MSHDYDVIVLGQGLAGTAVAWQLRWRGERVLVIDREAEVTSSTVAAGLITPVTGQRLVVSWRFADFWSSALAFYRRVEAETQMPCFRETPMVRIVADQGEQAVLHQRLTTRDFSPLVRQPPSPALIDAHFQSDAAAFEMLTAGQLDVPTYLRTSRACFSQTGGYLATDVHLPDDVQLTADGVSLPRVGVTAQQLVFCQGIAATTNPWFHAVQFRPAKGEILTLRIPGLEESRVVHRGVWLASGTDGLYRCGATYEWQTLDTVPTAAGRVEIEQRLQRFLRCPYDVVDQQAAVRPIHRQQYPVIGRHPKFPALGYLNGLGSKGTLQAPALANELIRVMSGGDVFDPRCDLNRWTELRGCHP